VVVITLTVRGCKLHPKDPLRVKQCIIQKNSCKRKSLGEICKSDMALHPYHHEIEVTPIRSLPV
jgi:hypothetical protein